MSLNIKDNEAHKLAHALAAETGETMTRAVRVALTERLQRVRRARKSKATAEELLAIGKRFRKHLRRPIVDHAELLYDEKGLPK
jgi:antitoxin VapB